MSTVVDKWIKEDTVMKNLKIRLYLNTKQKEIINEWFDTRNYVYNKTVNWCETNKIYSFQTLRNLLVSNETSTNSQEYLNLNEQLKTCNDEQKNHLNALKRKLPKTKNLNIKDWELNTPKEIRAYAVKSVCNAYKTGFSMLKANNLKFFKMKYIRKKDKKTKSITIAKQSLKRIDSGIQIYSNKLGVVNIKYKKPFEISHDSIITKNHNKYFIHIPIEIQTPNTNIERCCGVDMGVRSFATVYSPSKIDEYKVNMEYLKSIQTKINILKSNRIKKQNISKHETKLKNVVNEIHWKTINNILSNSDLILYGDIKSHSIVKHSKKKFLNSNFNLLKFYQFKTRLQYKALSKAKIVKCVNEAWTSQTCSFCGCITQVGSSKTYECAKCSLITDRDYNAAKNIFMIGLLN